MGEISITDAYDSEKSELGDFFKEKNSYKILSDTYTLLTENKYLHYYEVLPQSVEYIGEFECRQSMVNGDSSCIEQKIDGELITPLKAMMFNSLFADDINLMEKIVKGKMFQKIEYELDSEQLIPVILGAHYAKKFSINDTLLLMLIKCEGYLHYNNKSEYHHALYELKKYQRQQAFTLVYQKRC